MLKEAKVFLAGLGGLGSISAYYLAAAGVGLLRMVDMDEVDAGNLNRQILHWSRDIGIPKVHSAVAKLRSLNPNIQMETVQAKIRQKNVLNLVGDCSLIIDASDNLECRKALNIASVEKRIPFIYGGVDCFSAMVTTFYPGETPCLECILPGDRVQEKPVGVIGPVPGLVASIQALEAIKIIIGLEGTLKGRLISIQGLGMIFKEIKIEKNPDCVVCNSGNKE